MKGKTIVSVILVLVFLDQAIKVYIKTNFYYGEEHIVFDWFRIYFIENPRMAWGLKLGKGDLGKLALTLFRLAAVIWGTFWGRRYFEFFSPVFNTADVWVSTGVITLLLFQKKFFKNSDATASSQASLNEKKVC